MSVLATDSCIRGNSTGMGSANWTTVSTATSFNIASNTAATVAGTLGGNYWNAATWPNPQYGQITLAAPLATSTDEGVGPWVRVASGALTGYFIQAGAGDTRLYKVVAGTFTQLGTTGTASAAADVLKLVANGTTLTATRNGTAICGTPLTDASISSGNVGIFGSSTGLNAALLNFEGGDLNAGSPTIQATEQANRNRPGRGPFSKGRFFVQSSAAFSNTPQIYNLSITESGSASDAVTASEVANNAITEAGSATDTVTAASIFGQAITEAGTAADALTALLVVVTALTEAGSAADTSAGSVNALNTLTESGTAADAVSQGGSVFSQSITESGTAATVVTNVTTALNSITESGSAADSVSQGGSVFSQAVTEAGSAADALASFVTMINALVESGTAADSLSVTSGGATSVTESLSAAMAVSHLATLLNAVVEVGAANDALLVNGSYQALLTEVANAQDAIIVVAPFLVGGPRYVIHRLLPRRWIVSCNTYASFDAKAPDESVKLTFDFGPDLPSGVTLVGNPTVTFTVASGADANPSAVANGTALPNEGATAIIVPVDAGLDGVNYKIHVLSATSDPQLILSLSGILPVRA